MGKCGIEECIVQFAQAMYNNTKSKVRINNTYSDEFENHHGSVLSPLFFIIVLKALSRELLELLLILTSHALSYTTHGQIYSSYISCLIVCQWELGKECQQPAKTET